MNGSTCLKKHIPGFLYLEDHTLQILQNIRWPKMFPWQSGSCKKFQKTKTSKHPKALAFWDNDRNYICDPKIHHLVSEKCLPRQAWVLPKENMILRGKKYYNSLSAFASSHVRLNHPLRTTGVNGWDQCECKVGEDWFYINDHVSRIL